MAFKLGNFKIDEILMGVAEHDNQIVYTLDQLSSASIEISSESNDITDKNGNIVRTIYKNKTGTFTATNAFLHPQILNAATGANAVEAAVGAPIKMPKIEIIAAGKTDYQLDDGIVADTLQVIGLYGSGANTDVLEATTGEVTTGKYKYNSAERKLTVPAAGADAPVKYVVKYDRNETAGSKITNSANEFPQTTKMTFYCSYVDPCDDDLRACYVVLPSFQTSPETTVSLNSDEQEMDFNGNLQVDYCSADQALYYIFFPDENAVKVISAE